VPTTLSPREHELKNEFVRAVEGIMLEVDAQSAERMHEFMAEHGTGGDGGSIEDATVLDCLQLIVHNLRLK
jgi:hypothetical protein